MSDLGKGTGWSREFVVELLKAKLSVVEDVWDGEFMSKEEMEQYVDDLREELRIVESGIKGTGWKVCACGHSVVNHYHPSLKESDGMCLVPDCTCDSFSDHTASIAGLATEVSPEDLPPGARPI